MTNMLHPALYRTPRERIMGEIGLIALRHGTTRQAVLANGRTCQRVHMARVEAAAHLKDKGMGLMQIGRILNRHHTTILHALDRERRNASKRKPVVKVIPSKTAAKRLRAINRDIGAIIKAMEFDGDGISAQQMRHAQRRLNALASDIEKGIESENVIIVPASEDGNGA